MDREYNIHFRQESAATMAAIQALAAALTQLNQTAGQATTAVKGVGAGSASAAGGASSLGSALGSIVATVGGLAAAHQIISDTGRAYEDAAKFARDTARETIGIRDSLRELKMMTGDTATTDDAIRDVMDLRRATGLKQEEARDFLTQFRSGVFIAEDQGNLGPAGPAREKLKKELEEETALFAVENGIAPKEAAVLGSAIMAAGPVKSREEYATRLARSTSGVVKGQGELSEFAPALTRMIAEYGRMADEDGKGSGKLGDPETVGQMLGVVSAMTGNSPRRAATRMGQGLGELFDFEGDQGEWLKSVGVKPTDTALEALAKARPALEEAERSGEGADYFLQEHGFGNKQNRKALAYMAHNLPVVTERVRQVHEGGAFADASAQAHAKLQTKEMQNRLALAQADVGRQLVGLGNESAESALVAAEGQLQAGHQIDTAATNKEDRRWDMITRIPRAIGGGPNSRTERIYSQALDNLVSGGEAVGMDMSKFKLSWSEKTDLTKEKIGEMFREVVPEILARGGNPYGEMRPAADAMNQAAGAMNRVADALGGKQPGPAQKPPTPQARPAAPMRPGA